jgi:predicted DNA-binding WGR domain protein
MAYIYELAVRLTNDKTDKMKWIKNIFSKQKMKRILINQTGDSNKFWTIEQVDKKYIVQWGKIGTEGRSNEKEFSTRDDCSKEVEKLIKEKISKGYSETNDLTNIPVKQISEYKPMDEEVFWEIISSFNWKKTGDDDAVLRLALKRLVSMTVDDIQQFAEIIAEKLYNLDGLVYASNIGPESYKGEDEFFSNDYFLYVRCCVVANGKEYYESVLSDPTQMPKEMDFEALLYLADEAYNKKMKTENEMLDTKLSYETFSNTEKWK